MTTVRQIVTSTRQQSLVAAAGDAILNRTAPAVDHCERVGSGLLNARWTDSEGVTMLHVTRWLLPIRRHTVSSETTSTVVFRIALLVLMLLPLPGLAQDGSQQARPSAALPSLLKVGDDVKVIDQAGRGIRGRVTSITSAQLVVVARRAFFRQEERVFAIDSVRAVDVIDSQWNGALIGGAAAGVPLGIWAGKCKSGECFQGRALSAVFGTLAGFGVNAGIDSLINKRVYEQESQTPRVLVAPLLGGGRQGFQARVVF